MSITRPEFLRPQRGFGVVAAMVVTIVLAGLAILLARTTSTQATSVALDERGVRAYWAARAGLDWGSWQITQAGGCPASTTFSFPSGAVGFEDYSVTVLCNGRLITATACSPAADCGTDMKSRFYVERKVTRAMP